MSVLIDFCVGVVVMMGFLGILVTGWLIGSEIKYQWRRWRYDRRGSKCAPR